MTVETSERVPVLNESILPDYTATSILDIDFKALHDAGKQHVLLDLDLTLRTSAFARSGQPEIIDRLVAERTAGNIASITLATNSKSDLAPFREALSANSAQPFVEDGKEIKKPDPRFFKAALDQFGITADEAVMIGDRYKLDVVGAKRAGLAAILVEPLAKDYPLDILKRTRFHDDRAYAVAKEAFADHEIAAYAGEDSAAFEAAKLFRQRLERAKPYLFNLADQVIDAHDRRGWNLMVVDDTGARLVGRFLRFALESQGIKLPTAFICGSSSLRSQLPAAAYEQLSARMASSLSEPSPRALVVSEIAGTGRTLQSFDSYLNPCFETVDYAVVNARYPHVLQVAGEVYCGGSGRKSAGIINSAFERVGERSFSDKAGFAVINSLPYALYHRAYRQARKFADVRSTTSSTYPLTDVETPSPEIFTASTLPFARRAEDRTYRGVANYCSMLVNRIAMDYASLRS